MKKICFALIATSIFNLTVMAQSDNYCQSLRTELQYAIGNHNISEMDYRYYKLLNACGASESEMQDVEQVYHESKYDISWRSDKSYQINALPDPSIDWFIYANNMTYDDMSNEVEIKEQYKNVMSILNAVNIDVSTVSAEPRFFPHYRSIWIPQHNGGTILEMNSLKTLLTINNEKVEMNYAGAGVFLVDQNGEFSAYQLTNFSDGTETKIKKLITKKAETMYVLPVKSDEGYLAVTERKGDKALTSLYNNQGKTLFENQDYVMISQLSRTMILMKDGVYRLVDYDMNVILKDAEYIFEVWKDNQPYYLYDHPDGKRHLYDVQGKMILSGKDYKSISINQTPYAIVRKGKEYGVIDFVTQEVLVPFQSEKIHQLVPGFMTILKNGKCTIFDEKNRILSTIPAQHLSALTSRSQVLLRAVNENGKIGVYDLMGNEIIPMKYDEVEYKELEGKLLVSQGQTQFYTDLNGKEIKP